MEQGHCLKIASRIDELLQQELDQGIDLHRMLSEPLYTRDVLLVCDALHDSELPSLAAQFRDAVVALAADAAASGHESPGFSAARLINSIFGSPPSPEPGQERQMDLSTPLFGARLGRTRGTAK